MRVVTLEEIEKVLPQLDLIPLMEEGFTAYTRGEAVVPPVGEMIFDDPPGDVHIKYGYLRGGEHYVVKIASGFYRNPQQGLPSSNGLMLLFHQATGQPAALLLDEGRLTDVRTAAAGAVAAKHLAPRIERIGILGTGIQARLQLEHLKPVTSCRNVLVWGRRQEAAEAYAEEMGAQGWRVTVAEAADEVAESCDLLVTTTPATEPLFEADRLRVGAHVTAVGSDTAEKQELDPELLARAAVVVGDSLAQCRSRGEIYRAVQAGMLGADAAVELGAVIADRSLGRQNAGQITIADLTGVAVQDIQIAAAVFSALE
ncbi:MAG: ornithine cyclodeaminase family protein [Acidobacteriota bacterium]|nr:ornithine cyclodeaminase family protein [Acidobacteriota bacterium]